ncbi:hypothetical protein L0152_24865 [bacterium]|nr:hypothetical protein [bacterium]
MKFRIYFLLIFFFILTLIVDSEPFIRQIFPRQTVFLGEVVDWVIEVRHPLWEAYQISLKSPEGMEMRIIETQQQSIGNEMRSVYRIRIVPQSLAISGTPSVLITDGRGTNSVLNGKPLTVRTISGDSTEIKQAEPPHFHAVPNPAQFVFAGGTVVVLLALLIFLRIKRHRAATPRNVLLRQLRRLHQELRHGDVRNPLVLSKILRSELIWGFAAESFTATELKERADQKRQIVVEALETLDFTRYSNEPGQIQSKKIEEALGTAMKIVSNKYPEQKISQGQTV